MSDSSFRFAPKEAGELDTKKAAQVTLHGHRH